MNSAMSGMYCIPYAGPTLREQEIIESVKRRRKRLSPAERLWRMIERGRAPSLAQVRHELALADEDAVLQLVLDDDRLDVRTRPPSVRGPKDPVIEVIAAS